MTIQEDDDFILHILIEYPFAGSLEVESSLHIRKKVGPGIEPNVKTNASRTFKTEKGLGARGFTSFASIFKPENGFLVDDAMKVLAKFKILRLIEP